MRIRTPAVAGMFYPKGKSELQKSINDSFLHEFGAAKSKTKSEKVYGVICPHAGYMYSGPIATHSYNLISNQDFDLAVIIGPNHWGIGCNIATMKDCTWETPLGGVEVDSEAADEITKMTSLVEVDFFSHTKEHSIEVQVPMLQEFCKNKFKILPISLIDQEYDSAIQIGDAVSKLAENKKIMIIGSSDFTHYEPNEFAHSQDKALIEPILDLDVEKFYKILRERRISACGYGAIATTMVACEKLGATRGQLLKYATSGDITGDEGSVVGYASIVFT
ncbi:MEMO1 family protein [Candidatus Nitrosotenuis chungbukensis]|uniref:MEMO1 family protein n=1 Tax=Candidatus Nitrosotenuis chungbukensis TaxID=1353246 RepID=UPI0005B26145|nr:MEMO1 family protein [Candidatus Nitrosotenuis chungbukensis]WKT58776.1 MEMO1 family protein [Candidatus Nitrosotenuis chungbukensis]